MMDASELVFRSSSSVAGVFGCDYSGLLVRVNKDCGAAGEDRGNFVEARCGCSMRWLGRSPWAWSRVCCSTSLPALCPCMSD